MSMNVKIVFTWLEPVPLVFIHQFFGAGSFVLLQWYTLIQRWSHLLNWLNFLKVIWVLAASADPPLKRVASTVAEVGVGSAQETWESFFALFLQLILIQQKIFTTVHPCHVMLSVKRLQKI